MSVTVKTEQSHHRPSLSCTRLLGALRFSAHILELFSTIASVVCLLAIAWQLVSLGEVAAGILIFLQWCIIFAIFASIFHQAKGIFEVMAPRASFPFHVVAHRLRLIAMLWLVLVLVGLLFSILAAIIANGSFPAINVDLMPHSFPSPQTWYATFEQPDISSISHVVSIDLASASIGVLLWCLSYPLEFGGEIQEENELTA